MLNIIKTIFTIDLLNEIFEKRQNESIISSSRTFSSLIEMKTSTSSFSFANTTLRNTNSLIKSVIYDSKCSAALIYDKNRFLREINFASNWIKISNDSIKVKEYETMLIQSKLDNKIIKMKFDNKIYVLTTNMTLVTSVKLIKQEYCLFIDSPSKHARDRLSITRLTELLNSLYRSFTK